MVLPAHRSRINPVRQDLLSTLAEILVEQGHWEHAKAIYSEGAEAVHSTIRREPSEFPWLLKVIWQWCYSSWDRPTKPPASRAKRMRMRDSILAGLTR